MTRATRRSSWTTVDVVLLDPAWATALAGVERLVRKAARAATNNRKRSLTVALAAGGLTYAFSCRLLGVRELNALLSLRARARPRD